MSPWITDPKTKEPSVTLTAFVSGFVVCLSKLLLSGLTIAGVSMTAFSGTDFATAVGALGAIYVMRRHKPEAKQ